MNWFPRVFHLATRAIACDFEDEFACGYVIEGAPFRWQLLDGLHVDDGIGPDIDHDDSVLGKMLFWHPL